VGTQPNTEASTRATGSWTLEEDAKLTSAVANTSKKKYGKEYKTAFDAIAALVPGRTNIQCKNRWRDVLDPSIDQANKRTGRWTEDEDIKLKDTVQTHGGKNWGAIAALVPGRTNIQCRDRWHNALNPSIDRANERTGKWTADEDSTLKDAVQTHGSKNWGLTAALVPDRKESQCKGRWHDALNPSIG
jgi:myb proto-oncogene protein